MSGSLFDVAVDSAATTNMYQLRLTDKDSELPLDELSSVSLTGT